MLFLSVKFLNLFEKRSAFYLSQVSRTNKSTVRRLFEHLAQEELDNAARFGDALEKRIAETKWPQGLAMDIHQADIDTQFERLLRFPQILVMEEDDEMSSLQKAIELQTESVIFFSKLCNAAQTDAEFLMLAFLTKMERDHMVSMKQSLEYLEDPCAWTYPL